MTSNQRRALVGSYRSGFLSAAELWSKLGMWALAVFTAEGIDIPQLSPHTIKVRRVWLNREGYTRDGVYYGVGLEPCTYIYTMYGCLEGRTYSQAYYGRAPNIRAMRAWLRGRYPLAIVE